MLTLFGAADEVVDGFTRDQRFFTNFATVWRRNFTPDERTKIFSTIREFLAAALIDHMHIALVPILRDFVALQVNGSFLAVWLAHTAFGLPLAIYLLRNFFGSLPREIPHRTESSTGRSTYQLGSSSSLPLAATIVILIWRSVRSSYSLISAPMSSNSGVLR